MAAIESNVTDGIWGDKASWMPQQIPVTGDTVTIKANHSIRIDNMTRLSGITITINADGEMLFSGRSHNIYR